jgi:hypothetical protein
MFGMIPTYIVGTDTYFARGYRSGDTATGPSGVPGGRWSWDVDGTYADWYAGHEIAHLLERDHPTPNGDPDPDEDPREGCGHSQSDDSFPYSDARIGTGDLYGFDMGDPKIAGIENPSVYPPNGAFDMMSYCHPIQWISDYTYKGLYNEIADLDLAQAANATAMKASGPYLYLYGIIHPQTEEANLIRVRTKNGAYTLPAVQATDYAVRMLDGNGGPLATVDVPVAEDPDSGDRLLVTADLALTTGTRKVELVHKPSGKVYADQSFSANPPTIGNVAISPATSPVSGTVNLSWTAADADGDALTFDVHYSMDNGATYQPLLANLTGSSTPINTLELGGSSQARFRVTAFDGSHTANAETATFTMASKPPVVHIDNPGTGLQVHYGQLINFIGDAFDPQGAAFAPVDLQWRSEDGPLGTGPMLTVTDLPVGEHTITFTAKNAAGLSASASITVVVDDDLSIPGPTLSVAPGEIGWQFAEGATATQTAELSIANVGSGSLNWTAGVQAPWLTLSAAAGAAPAKLTVTADPTKIPNGESASSAIVVTGTVGGGTVVGTVTVPAHAVFGNNDSGGPVTPEQEPGPGPGPGPDADVFLRLPLIEGSGD